MRGSRGILSAAWLSVGLLSTPPATDPVTPDVVQLDAESVNLLRAVRGIAGQIEALRGERFDHGVVAVRTPEGNAAFFVNAGFVDVHVDLIAHYNVLRFLHWLSALPGIGSWFKARIFLTARKPNTLNGTLETRE